METLSDKKHPDWEIRTDIKGWYLHDDVKEFIRKLKEAFPLFEGNRDPLIIHNKIEKLAGDELT